jgi:threonine synthase
VVASEKALKEANDLARGATDVDVDPTGSAGLAGSLELVRAGAIQPDATVAVLFTGVSR